jgi:uncharacterized short protein YbdD (DUF466 family)
MPKSLAVWQAVKGGYAFARRTVLLMIGIPDYERYVRHAKEHHPDQPVMTYEEFFKNRQDCRYGDGRMGRCC